MPAGWTSAPTRTGSEANFLEVNPLAGLHPEHSDLPIVCNLAGSPIAR